MIQIHDWQTLGRLNLFEPRLLKRCRRCGIRMSLTDRDAAILCPPEEEAVAMFVSPVLCESYEGMVVR